MEIPIYLFTGFLDSGKSTFIQKTLEDPQFNQGESTLLLICEEGETEYNPSVFAESYVFLEHVASIEGLTKENLDRKCKKHACERVIVEYNGMWMLDHFYQAMPKEWVVYQEFMFVDAGTFSVYNANMRELVVDKLKSCEMVVLNRTPSQFDRVALHKIVRGSSRRAEIVYEDEEGNISYDDTPDELPFDLSAPIVPILTEDYAMWYRDISEEMDKYDGKVIRVSGYVVHRADLPDNTFIFGRQLMTCCVDDMTFAGVLCVWEEAKTLRNRSWMEITAKIALRQNKIYNRKGPVLQVLDVKEEAVPVQDVATFF